MLHQGFQEVEDVFLVGFAGEGGGDVFLDVVPPGEFAFGGEIDDLLSGMGVHPPLGGFPAVDVEEEAHVGFQGQSVVGPEVEAGEIVFPGTLPDLVDAHPHDLQIQAGVPEAGEAADEFFVVQILEVVAAVEDGGMEAIAKFYEYLP